MNTRLRNYMFKTKQKQHKEFNTINKKLLSPFTCYFKKLILFCSITIGIIVLTQNILILTTEKPINIVIPLGVLSIIAIALFQFIQIKVSTKVYAIIIVAISFFSRLLFVFIVKTPIKSDFLVLYNAACNLVSGDKSWLNESYFTTWGYQIPFVYYEALVLKVFHSKMALDLLNVFFMTGTNLIIFMLAKKIASLRTAFIAAFMYTIYPAPILLTTVLTNQHISLFFIMSGICFLLHDLNNKHVLLASMFLCIGNLMRPEGIIVICSVLIYLTLLTLKSIKLKTTSKILKSAFIFLISYILLTQLAAFSFKLSGAAPQGIKNNCPQWKFVLGLDTETTGVYNEKNSYIVSIEDSKQRTKELQRIIKNSFKSYMDIPLLFLKKSNFMWANMENTSWSLLHLQKSKSILSVNDNFSYSKFITLVLSFDKLIYMLQYIFLIITSCILWKKHSSQNEKVFFFITLICLNYSIYLLIEIQTRYRYFIMPVFFIISAFAIDLFLSKNLNRTYNQD